MGEVEGQAPEAARDVPVTPLDTLRAEVAREVEAPRLYKRFTRGTHTGEDGRVVPGRIVGEYRPSKKKEVRDAAAAEADEYLLSECLVRILILDAEGADPDTPEGQRGLVPLGKWSGRAELDPLRLDNRLCDLLGLPQTGDPKRIALELFEGNDLVLAEVAGEIATWSLDVHNRAYQDFTTASSR